MKLYEKVRLFHLPFYPTRGGVVCKSSMEINNEQYGPENKDCRSNPPQCLCWVLLDSIIHHAQGTKLGFPRGKKKGLQTDSISRLLRVPHL